MDGVLDEKGEGQIEIWIAGEWKSVCDDIFDHNGAHVVCQQLGLPHACKLLQ